MSTASMERSDCSEEKKCARKHTGTQNEQLYSLVLDEPVDSSGMHADVNVIELESEEEPQRKKKKKSNPTADIDEFWEGVPHRNGEKKRATEVHNLRISPESYHSFMKPHYLIFRLTIGRAVDVQRQKPCSSTTIQLFVATWRLDTL